MNEPIKYTIITVESYLFGWETKYFYLPKISSLNIGDVIISKSGKHYRIIDGTTPLELSAIDLSKYTLFE